jgi:hypothetical protein
VVRHLFIFELLAHDAKVNKLHLGPAADPLHVPSLDFDLLQERYDDAVIIRLVLRFYL